MHYTYILKPLKSSRYYIRHTSNTEERLNRHNSNKVTVTKNKGLWVVACLEMYETKVAANSRKLYIKSMKSRVYLEKLILSFKQFKKEQPFFINYQ